MDFLILLSVVFLNYQVYKLVQFILTVDQQSIDMDIENKLNKLAPRDK
jgi:hypothetical protein